MNILEDIRNYNNEIAKLYKKISYKLYKISKGKNEELINELYLLISILLEKEKTFWKYILNIKFRGYTYAE